MKNKTAKDIFEFVTAGQFGGLLWAIADGNISRILAILFVECLALMIYLVIRDVERENK